MIKLIESKFANTKINFKNSFEAILKFCKTQQDDKIKFVLKDESWSEENINAVYKLLHDEEQIKIVKANEGAKKNKKGQIKATYDPEIFEKFPASLSATVNKRIVVFNPTFERVFRHNIIECINKQFKMEDPEKDNVKAELEGYLAGVTNNLIEEVAQTMGKDLFDHKLDNDPSGQDNMEMM